MIKSRATELVNLQIGYNKQRRCVLDMALSLPPGNVSSIVH
jgi:hypothetical protein